MKGLWFDHIQYGRARDMARFGLLIQAKGVWNGDTLPETGGTEVLAGNQRFEYCTLDARAEVAGQQLGQLLQQAFLAADSDVGANAVAGQDVDQLHDGLITR